METTIYALFICLVIIFLIPIIHTIIFSDKKNINRPLYKFKKRDAFGRITNWEHITTEEILAHKYFNNFFFGRFYRKIAIRVFEIVFEIKEQKNA